MKRTVTLVAALAIAALLGWWVGSQREMNNGPPAAESTGDVEPEIVYWVAPMDPQFRRDGPGKSPMGMDLVPVYADDLGSEGDGVRISPSVVQNLGVRTVTVERGPLWRLMRATGRVEIDQSLISHVHLRTAGWVEDTPIATTGVEVAAGDILARIYSPDLVAAQKEYLNAQRRGNDALVAGAAEKLRALGFIGSDLSGLRDRGTVAQTFAVTAPRSGVVSELGIREGMFIEPGKTLMSIVDLSRVWVQAQVLESQASWVAAGQSADLVLEALPGVFFSGVVTFVDPILDPMTRTLDVRLEFENPDQALKPNMFGAVKIYGGAQRNVLSVPSDALILDEDADRLVVALGNGHFESREVIAGMRSGDWIEIREGVAEGEQVVVSAQFLIDSEASLSGSIRRLDPGHPTDRGSDQ